MAEETIITADNDIENGFVHNEFVLHVSSADQWRTFASVLDRELGKLVQDRQDVPKASLGAFFLNNIRLDEAEDLESVATKVGEWILGKRGSSLLSGVASIFKDDYELARPVRWGADEISDTGDIKTFGSLLCALLGLNVRFVRHEDAKVKDLVLLQRALEVSSTFAKGRTPLPLLKTSDYVRVNGAAPIDAYLNWHAHRAALTLLRPYLAAACASPNFEDAIHRAYRGRWRTGARLVDLSKDLASLSNSHAYVGEMADDATVFARKDKTTFYATHLPNALFHPSGRGSMDVPDGATNVLTFSDFDQAKAKKALGDKFKQPTFDVELWQPMYGKHLHQLQKDLLCLADPDVAYCTFARRLAASMFLGMSIEYEEWEAHLLDRSKISVAEALGDNFFHSYAQPEAHYTILAGSAWVPAPRFQPGLFESRDYSVYVGTILGRTASLEGDSEAMRDLIKENNPLVSNKTVTFVFGTKKVKVTYAAADAKAQLEAEKASGLVAEALTSIWGTDSLAMSAGTIDDGTALYTLKSEVVK